ncbi:MAG: glutathione peroxidase [Algoriphagus sp.]|jgi:glutathione peroxidase|uniref:glutathione peroxidase n=1 Tax=Algoriphagus sp. TaxID=1872435 RepID=UPI00271FF6FE|nr:glutathione peroxidase [Algoriphagus sp.]MDO8965883.1 glutathione peroxidase [Algoriphagus sp.]MDP2042039.1 glutathione peroxidase [Algoriphagus sp.]MDP3201065.1 glutathione peroxidase [Algoriphagus sp.]MDP3473369.1 glutathione peroxidase [Algoriphagus sp.]
MKTLLLIISIILFACGKTLERPTNQAELNPSFDQSMESSFYDFKLTDINGKEVDFSEFKGKKLLLVNVASKCGYTKQYAQLQELYAAHGDKIMILGFPANNFGGQEPGSNEEIKAFCDAEFGVTFPMFEKISVKGFDKHPLYRWLSDATQNGWNNEEPSWNFCKYFVNEQGELVKFFPSSVAPLDEEILKLIGA